MEILGLMLVQSKVRQAQLDRLARLVIQDRLDLLVLKVQLVRQVLEYPLTARYLHLVICHHWVQQMPAKAG
jgi:hypothetical protein